MVEAESLHEVGALDAALARGQDCQGPLRELLQGSCKQHYAEGARRGRRRA